MKKLSIKLRITSWFTIFMILLSAVVFLFIAVLSDTSATHQIRGELVRLTEDNLGEIEYDDGQLEIDDDFIAFQNGIYCLVFSADGAKISGYAPHEELENLTFADGDIRSLDIRGESGAATGAGRGSETYLVYDRFVSFPLYDGLWIRSVVSENDTAITSAIYRAALIALPLLIFAAAGGGYLIAAKSLLPIKKISETAETIGNSGDLSKRIELDGSGDELHQLAGTFNRMFDRLETNFEAERHFTSDASHELRTPVATILAQCEYAFENAAGEQELYEALGTIQKQGYRMTHLIESLLEFTRIEQQTEGLSWELLDLSHIVASLCQERKDYSAKNITLKENIQPGIHIKSDRTLLSRMLVNLLSNAERYGKVNGTVLISLTQNAFETVLSVADDGIGIAPEELPKIWNRFYRVDKARSPAKSAGIGLGLAMVKQIAELHGGTVTVESALGKGSIFIVRFGGSGSMRKQT